MLKRISTSLNINEKKKEIFFSIITISLALLTLSMLAGNLGVFDPLFMRFCAVCLLIAIITISLLLKTTSSFKKTKELSDENRKRILVGLILIAAAFAILLFTETPVLWLSSIPILLSGLDVISYSFNMNREELGVLSLSSFIYAIFIVFIYNIPFFWLSIQKFSLIFSQGLGKLVGKPMLLGPSANGLWILLLFFMFYIGVFFTSGRKIKKFALAIFGLILAWIIYLLIILLYPFNNYVDLSNSQYVFFLFGLVPTFLYVFKIKKLDFHIYLPNVKNLKLRKLWKKTGVWMLILLFFSGFILTTFIGAGSEKGKILINSKSKEWLGSWDKPEYDVYGTEASGMLGFLPIHLNNFGYTVELLDDNITENTFEDVDVFVVFNPKENFTSREHELIWNFIKNDGSLLVVGDHTDVSGIKEPLNNLLKPAGINFRFDSALPLNNQIQAFWASCMQFLHHPVNKGISNENQVGISIGASLDVSKNAFPVIIGKYAFSDIGNYSNEKSFLGDFKYNPDEQLDDVILAAGSYYGNGRVLVFGDSTLFQNLEMSYSYPTVYNAFQWLTSQQTNYVKNIQISISLLLLASIVLLYKISKEKKLFSVFFPIIFCIALLTSGIINPVITGEEEIQGPVFYIDTSHGEKINLDHAALDATSGLTINLQRNNYSSFILPVFSKALISQSEGVIFIAPTISFSDSELDFLKKYISDGGLVILCAGYQDQEPVELLMKEFNLEIKNQPLGAVPYNENKTEEPRFVDSWPIITDEKNEDTRVFYSITIDNVQYDLVVFKKHGKGGFLVIGDSQFLLDKNLESLDDYWPGNVDFLKNIIHELQKLGVL